MKLIKDGSYNWWDKCAGMDIRFKMVLHPRIHIDIWVILRSQMRDVIMNAANSIYHGTST